MILKRKNNFAFLALLFGFCVFGTKSFATADSSKLLLNKDEFIAIVRQYHPIVQQAQIGVDKSKAALLEQRGAFDPTVVADYSNKVVEGKGYYNYFNPEIVVPTWYGIDLKAGLENNNGDFTNREFTLGQTSYLGVKTGLHQLLFDKRRATLQQAKSMVKLSKAEQELAVNDVLFDALAAYWHWVKTYEVYRLVAEALNVSRERFKFVKIEYEQGSKPAIDTTEALTQLQSFEVMEQDAFMEWQNAGLALNNFMWLPDNKPMTWSTAIKPTENALNNDKPETPALSELLVIAESRHPKLQSLDYKIDILQIERKLKAQSFIPKLSVSANALSKGYSLIAPTDRLMFENNHKIGVDLSVPLFMRQARGAYQQAKLKVEETKIEQGYIALEISNKIKSYYNEVSSLQNQIESYQEAYASFNRLYQGELLRFNAGESTLFIMNARQNKLLEAGQKLVELKAKWRKSYAALFWSAAELD